MTNTTRIFDAAAYLDGQDAIAAYLQAAFEEGDLDLIRKALTDVIRAKGIQDIADATGLTRAEVDQAVCQNGNPTLSTLLAMTKALGVKLSIAA